jgi:hypothetical protein
VLPGFLWGMTEYRQSMIWAAFIALAANFAFFAGFVLLLGASKADRSVAGFFVARSELRPVSLAPIVVFNVLLALGGLALYGGIPPGTTNAMMAVSGGLDEATANSLSEARRTLTKGHLFGGAYAGQGLIRELLFAGFLFLVPLAWQQWRVTRRWIHGAAFAVTFFLAYVWLSGDGTRAPFLLMIVAILVAESLLRPVSAKKVLFAGIAVIVLAIALSAYSAKMYQLIDSGGPAAAVKAVVERITVGNSVNDAFAVKLVDSNLLPLGYGKWLWRDAVAAVPGVSGGPPLSYELYLKSDNPQGNTTFLTGTLIARGYADGAIAGVVLSFFLMGLLCAGTDLLVLAGRNSVAWTAFLTALFVAVGRGYMVGLVGVAVKVAVLCVVAGPYMLIVLSQRRRRRLSGPAPRVRPAHAGLPIPEGAPDVV